jgi:hypothetical protein
MSDVNQPVMEPVLTERRPQPGGEENRNINNCYWHRAAWEQDANWILVGPGPETTQAQHWQRHGRVPLEELSVTDRISPKTGRKERIEYGADNLARNRYYWLLKNGGAKEFPIAQVVAYKWHIKPPYGMSREAFPQLEEYELPDPYWCALCPPEAMPKNSATQLLQHLMVGHKLPLQEAKPLLADASKPPTTSGIDPVLRKKRTPEEKAAEEAERVELMAKMEAETIDFRDPTKGRLTICQSCGEQIAGKLADHNCT